MLGILFLLFVAVPIVEIVVLVKLGSVVGFLPTMALVLLTGAVGAFLARTQGLRALRSIQAELAAGRVPAARLLDGMMILIGGIVLLTPGLLTDLLGLSLLFPPTRALAKRWLAGRIQKMVREGRGNIRFMYMTPPGPRQGGPVEVEEVEPLEDGDGRWIH